MIHDNLRSRSLTFVQDHSDSTFSNFFSSNKHQAIEAKFQNFNVAFVGMLGMKMCSNIPGNMTMMTSRPIYEKNFKNLLQNQEADDLETWYTASGTLH